MIKKFFFIFCLSIVFVCLDARESAAAFLDNQVDRAEVLLRALWQVGDKTIKPENQHCNLGNVYLTKINPSEKDPVKIKEPLLAEIAEMSAGGSNRVTASCEDKSETQCSLILSHVQKEEANSTEYKFLIIDGVIETDSLECISTP